MNAMLVPIGGCVTKNPGNKRMKLPADEAKTQVTHIFTLCTPLTLPLPPTAANPQPFPGLPQSKTKPPSNNRNTLSLSVPAFTTLPEAGVKGPRAVQIQAVHDWLQTQVNHLVEAELAAVNGCGFGLQGYEELLGTFR